MTRHTIGWILEHTRQNRAVRVVVLTPIYLTTVAFCIWTAYQVRFDFDVPSKYDRAFPIVALIDITAKLLGLLAFGQFEGRLSYFGKPDLKRLVTACSVASVPLFLMSAIRGSVSAPPRGVVPIDIVLCVVTLSAVRVSFWHLRCFVLEPHRLSRRAARRLGIVGANDVGALLARHLMNEPSLELRPVAFFDDVCESHVRVHGIPVVGTAERLAEFKTKLNIQEIIIAMPSAPAKRVHEVLELAHAAGLECKTMPSLGQLATGRVQINSLQSIKIEDLLGRIPVRIKTEILRDILTARTVLVTGAGGSIGSELCRQILSFEPTTLLLVERSEPHLFQIQEELLASCRGTSIVPLVGDVASIARMRAIFSRFQPQVIFHAAAHKHVPMMEHQPAEAIRNNLLGTALIADLAVEHGVDRFIFISTDKAVNPSSVMGATKRCAEIYLQALANRPHTTKFMAVRFGNVLGSSGSVVPTFAKQIAAGGPVTVTHPEVTRFFMTIPEAVTLVLEASAFGKGGEIFMLDMGTPIKIVDLAAQMILLSGLKPHEDIDIVFTGLRPGEKLEEALSYSLEQVTPTEHPQITRLISSMQSYSCLRILIDGLAAATENANLSAQDLKELLVKAVPEYTPFVENSAKAIRKDARGTVVGSSTGTIAGIAHGLRSLPEATVPTGDGHACAMT